jgi:hypothetical protein
VAGVGWVRGDRGVKENDAAVSNIRAMLLIRVIIEGNEDIYCVTWALDGNP